MLAPTRGVTNPKIALARGNRERDFAHLVLSYRSKWLERLVVWAVVAIVLREMFVPVSVTHEMEPKYKHVRMADELIPPLHNRIRETNDGRVHVVFCYDSGSYNIGMKGLVNSIINQTATPTLLSFHAIVLPSDLRRAQTFVLDVRESYPHITIDYSVWYYWDTVKHHFPTTNRFSHGLNLARIYLQYLFPHVEKMFSFDTDQVVNGDVATLYHSLDLTDMSIASSASEHALPISHYVYAESPHIVESNLDLSTPSFGGGLFIANLTTWRAMDFPSQVHSWLAKDRSDTPWLRKALKKTLLNVIFQGSAVMMPEQWNAGNCYMNRTESLTHNILHFAGFDGKPWDRVSNCHDDSMDLWEEYFDFHKYYPGS